MSVEWEIKYGSVTKTLEGWGLKDLVLVRTVLAPDTLTFRHVEAEFDGAEIFATEDTITLLRDGVRYFEGTVMETPKSTGPGGDEDTYTVLGGWYVLDNYTYQQSWQSWDNATSGYVTLFKSHVMIGQDVNGQPIDSGAQIQDAVDYVNTQGGPLQFGATDLDVNIPVDDVRDIVCGEVVKKMVRWSPDAVAWFDYSTNPPTFYCKHRAALDSETIDLDDEDRTIEVGKLTKRSDLKRPAIVINYEITSQVNGQPLLSTITDKAPNSSVTGREMKALNLTINLQGYSITQAFQDVEVQDVDIFSLAWWQYHFPYLKDGTLTDMQIDGTPFRYSSYPRELIGGQLASWMEFSNGNPVEWYRDECQATISYTDVNGNKVTKLFRKRIVATNAVTGKYSTVASYQAGEAVPNGIAQQLYDSLGSVQYEGNVTISADDVDGVIAPGKKLNIINGRSEWETMDAIVWSTTEEIDNGKTIIKLGPPKTLSSQDLIELSRVNRNRLITTNLLARTTAIGGVAGNVEMPKEQPGQTGAAGTIDHKRLKVRTDGKITMDLDSERVYDFSTGQQIVGAETGVEMLNFKVPYCLNGVDGHIIVNCSRFVPTPT